MYSSFCSSGCFLHSYMVLSPRGVSKPPSAFRQMLPFVFIFLSIASLCFPVFLSNHLVSRVAVKCCWRCYNKGNKENDKGGETRSFAVYLSEEAGEGKRKEEDEGEDEIRGEKMNKRGTGKERINNPAKKMSALSWQPQKWESKKLWL